MLASVYITKPGYAAFAPPILPRRHVQTPSIPGFMQINLTKDLAGRVFSADRLARIGGAIPEYTADLPSTSRWASSKRSNIGPYRRQNTSNKETDVGRIFLLLTLLFFSVSASAGHVYFEYGLGKVTAGYDVQKNETEIRKFYLAAEGPGDLKDEAYAYCRNCIEESMTLAASAAYATPGEASARLAAAIQVWNVSFPKCMSGRAFAKALIKQFRIGITERREREHGLVLTYSGGQFNAELYNAYYKELDKRLPGGDGANLVRKFAELQAKFEAAKVIDINLKVPDEITNVGSRLVQIQTAEAQKLVANLAARIKDQARPEKIAQAVPEVLKMTQGVAVQIAAATGALQNIENILPHLPPGPSVPNLGDGLGKVGQQMNDLGKAVFSGTQQAVDCIRDSSKCPSTTIPNSGGATVQPAPSVPSVGGNCISVCTPTIPSICKDVCR